MSREQKKSLIYPKQSKVTPRVKVNIENSNGQRNRILSTIKNMLNEQKEELKTSQKEHLELIKAKLSNNKSSLTMI
jgi:hypothetical protein